MSAEQRLQIYIVNGSDGRCLVAVRLMVDVRYLERPLKEVILYVYITQLYSWAYSRAGIYIYIHVYKCSHVQLV